VEFIQAFGITQTELNTFRDTKHTAQAVIEHHMRANALLMTDLSRKDRTAKKTSNPYSGARTTGYLSLRATALPSIARLMIPAAMRGPCLYRPRADLKATSAYAHARLIFQDEVSRASGLPVS
jgi:hypothetical protein